jgi:hypothetical protein
MNLNKNGQKLLKKNIEIIKTNGGFIMKTIDMIRKLIATENKEISTFDISKKLSLGINQISGSISIMKKNKEVVTYRDGVGKNKITMVMPTQKLVVEKDKIGNYATEVVNFNYVSDQSKKLKQQMENYPCDEELKAKYVVSRLEDIAYSPKSLI